MKNKKIPNLFKAQANYKVVRIPHQAVNRNFKKTFYKIRYQRGMKWSGNLTGHPEFWDEAVAANSGRLPLLHGLDVLHDVGELEAEIALNLGDGIRIIFHKSLDKKLLKYIQIIF